MRIDFTSLVTIIILICLLAFYILYAVAQFKLMTKAGEKWWKALIPFYNVFTAHHVVGMSHVWFVLEIFCWITEIVLEVFHGIPPVFGLIFAVPTIVITALSEIIYAIKLCDCFGKGIGYKIGTILFTEVFLMIFAYGKAKFKRPDKH